MGLSRTKAEPVNISRVKEFTTTATFRSLVRNSWSLNLYVEKFGDEDRRGVDRRKIGQVVVNELQVLS